ncbi:zinc transporter [Trypanosoma grayi]|uniref:zinc transporter n=1 Tax=Trypanosoma grayi TaxID=71804 RepID=UPI0004F3F1FA|nr:zinc transporter [Trypanosoma grayi]KEG11652.1 zinc transporter [Trypanosoma grayi]
MDRSVNVIQCAAAPTRIQCEEINAKLMLGVGVFGLCMNIVLAVIMSFGAAHPHSHGMLSSVEFDHDVDYHSRDNHHGHSHLHHEHQHRDGCSHSHGNGGADMQRLECASPESEMMEEVVVETTSSNAESICSHERGSQSMNLRAAVLHVFGDCLQSLGVVLAACVIWAGNNSSVGVPSSAHSYYNLADPLLSVLFGVITVYTTLNLFKEVIVILLEQVPPAVEYTVARDALLSVEKVQAVDDLHIWAVGPGFSVLSAHLCTNGCATTSEANAVVEDAECRCRQLGIVHTTIQLKHAADVRNTGA